MKINTTSTDLPSSNSQPRGSRVHVDFGEKTPVPEHSRPRPVDPDYNDYAFISVGVCHKNVTKLAFKTGDIHACLSNYEFGTFDFVSGDACAAKFNAGSVCGVNACAGADFQVGTACLGNACAGANLGATGLCAGKVCAGVNVNFGLDTGPCLGVNLPNCPFV